MKMEPGGWQEGAAGEGRVAPLKFSRTRWENTAYLYWRGNFCWLGSRVQARQCSVGSGQNWAPSPQHPIHGRARLNLMTRLSLVPVQLPKNLQGQFPDPGGMVVRKPLNSSQRKEVVGGIPVRLKHILLTQEVLGSPCYFSCTRPEINHFYQEPFQWALAFKNQDLGVRCVRCPRFHLLLGPFGGQSQSFKIYEFILTILIQI